MQVEESSGNMQAEGTSEKQPKPQREYKLAEPEIVNEDEVMMDQLMKFLEQHIEDDGLRIEDMAEAVNCFKKETGKTPSEYRDETCAAS